MAVLSDEERRRTWGHLMRAWSAGPGSASIPVNKTDLRAAVDATDAWIEANQASFNSALPQPFRGAATAPQKTLMFCYVAMRRAGLLVTQEDGT
jgi:hypothetical protein